MKILLAALSFFIFSTSYSQEKNQYYSDYFKQNYIIGASAPKDGNFRFIINCQSTDDNTVGFILEKDQANPFCTQLEKVKNKYSEWCKVATENNVKSYTKDFETEFEAVSAFFTFVDDWHFDFGVEMKPYFMVTKNGEQIVVFKSRKLIASDNEFIKSDGFMLVFSSNEEIENFIKLLDVNSVINKENKKAEIDKLFN